MTLILIEIQSSVIRQVSKSTLEMIILFLDGRQVIKLLLELKTVQLVQSL